MLLFIIKSYNNGGSEGQKEKASFKLNHHNVQYWGGAVDRDEAVAYMLLKNRKGLVKRCCGLVFNWCYILYMKLDAEETKIILW